MDLESLRKLAEILSQVECSLEGTSASIELDFRPGMVSRVVVRGNFPGHVRLLRALISYWLSAAQSAQDTAALFAEPRSLLVCPDECTSIRVEEVPRQSPVDRDRGLTAFLRRIRPALWMAYGCLMNGLALVGLIAVILWLVT